MAVSNQEKSTIRAWAEILRLPNVLSVPGDVWLGMALLGGVHLQGRGLLVLGSVCCLYLAGMLQNALVDVEADRLTRPERPLPSGRLTASAVAGAMRLLFNAGLAMALFSGKAVAASGLALLLMVWLYHRFKANAAVAVLCMGACRALSVGMGMAYGAQLMGAWNPVWLAVPALWWVYISGVTALARKETKGGWVTPSRVGWLLRGLFVLQAVGLWWCEEPVLAAAVLGLAVLSVGLRQWIAAS